MPCAVNATKRPYFTKENAREFAARGLQKRRENAEKRRQAIEAEERAKIVVTDCYISDTLLHVREQIKRLGGMIAKEKDAQCLDRLASAYAKLSDQERILSGRPMPGSLRPKAPKEPKPAQSSGISDEFAPA